MNTSKILLFIDCLGAGGAQRQFVGLASFLKAKGLDVFVLTYFDIPFYNHFLDVSNVPHEVVECAGSHYKRIPLVKKAFDKFSPDVVIAYQETPSLIACIIKFFGAKWKLIVSERNTTQINNWKECFRFNFFRKADFVVPNSYSQERFIQNHYSFLVDKTVTISNFVDTDHFTPAEVTPHNEKKKIIIAASIWESKNTLGLINALALLKKRTEFFHVRWYGKNESNLGYFNRAMALIEELGLKSEIELLDKTNDIVGKYRESCIFCLPSFYEGTPNVICEAMACGLPIACSNVCDNAIYVEEGSNGWLFNPSDPEDIANKLYEAVSASEDTLNAYSLASRKKAVEKLSKEEFANKYISLIDKSK